MSFIDFELALNQSTPFILNLLETHLQVDLPDSAQADRFLAVDSHIDWRI